MEYKQASAAEAIAEGTVIPQWKRELEDFAIRYVSVERMNSKGEPILGRVKKCSALEKHIHEYDLIVLVNEEKWQQLEEKQRIALVHHLLCHVMVGDEGALVMVNPDVSDFTEVVRHHGAWRSDLEHLCSQLELKLNEGVEGPKPRLDVERTEAPSEEKAA